METLDEIYIWGVYFSEPEWSGLWFQISALDTLLSLPPSCVLTQGKVWTIKNGRDLEWGNQTTRNYQGSSKKLELPETFHIPWESNLESFVQIIALIQKNNKTSFISSWEAQMIIAWTKFLG